MSGLHSRQPFHASPDLITALKLIGEEQQHKAGSLLFAEGDAPNGVFLIVSGSVSLSLSDSDRKKCFSRVAGPDCVLGLPSTITNQPYSLTAKVLEDALVRFVRNTTLQECLGTNPALCLDVLNVLAEEIRRIRVKQRQSK
jgi:CRP-like cAMP-binding protein